MRLRPSRPSCELAPEASQEALALAVWRPWQLDYVMPLALCRDAGAIDRELPVGKRCMFDYPCFAPIDLQVKAPRLTATSPPQCFLAIASDGPDTVTNSVDEIRHGDDTSSVECSKPRSQLQFLQIYDRHTCAYSRHPYRPSPGIILCCTALPLHRSCCLSHPHVILNLPCVTRPSHV